MANTANDGLMLPERVWDDQPPAGESSGKGTRSATPLAWTHGESSGLAWSIDAGRSMPRPPPSYSPACASEAGRTTLTAYFDGWRSTSGLSISFRRSISLIHCLGLSTALTCFAALELAP
jgi:hypothetical protein